MGESVKEGTAVRFQVECPRCACVIPLAILREENVTEERVDEKPELLALDVARKHVPEKDCGGRYYTAIEREDIARFMVEGAEIQRDKDYFWNISNDEGEEIDPDANYG
ncbi:hypothetical protein LCGC14_0381450 [marine sediment metagenome]|uniref:Uncharacterized protein n=1 Tax=marine sediment metagenome TaxID=412755 RepID=A0A0F9WAZ2_9ZZZZ